MPSLHVLLALSALASPPSATADEGYDFLILEMPRRIVAGDTLRFEALGRPGNPFVILGDRGRQLSRFGSIYVHLDLSGALFLAGSGVLPSSGNRLFSLPTPAAPELDGLTIYFQAFGDDPGVYNRAMASDGKALTFHRDAAQPLITLLTVNRIPGDQNGSEPGDGILHVPQKDFTVDVFFDERGQGPIDPQSLVISADQPLAGGQIPPGTNLSRFFTITPLVASAKVDALWSFPNNARVTLTAQVKNQGGNASPRVSFVFLSRAFPSNLRPFAAKQIWYLDFDTNDLDQTGVADSREDLLLYGLGSNARETAGPSFNAAQWTRRTVMDLLRRNYGVGTNDPVNIDFTLMRPNSGAFSTICIGGRNGYPVSALPPGAKETTGAAYFDPRNQSQEFLCRGVLGTHPRSIYFLFKDVPAFKVVFDPLIANPVGNDPDDPIVTASGFDPGQATPRQRTRWLAIKAGVEAYANATSFVAVQETSHSMGLVPSAPLPNGLLGGYNFGHSTDAHFDDGRGNFLSGNNSTPAPAQPDNLALIWDHFQSGRGHFTPLNWAYLRERVINN